MLSVKAFFGYLFYTLLVAALFLVLLFPDQAVKAYVDGRLAAIDPALTMQAESIRPALPPGLKMTGVDLNRDSVRLAHVDDARVSPELSPLLKGKKQFQFLARLADGTIQGRAMLPGTSPSDRLRVEADLARIHLDRLDAVRTNERFTLFGSLDGRITHEKGRAPTGGTTNGRLTVSELRIALKSPFFGITELVMDQSEAEFVISGQRLRLKTLTFGGPMVEGKITGSIELRTPLEQSRLNLSGNAKPRPELVARLQEAIPAGIIDTRTLGSRGVMFRVDGSLDNPDISMR
jgi:type II secretion system protein N